jgi:predicted nucleic acid-binding protein
MRLLDTNILLRYFLNDDAEKAQRALLLLEKINRNEEKAELNSLVLFECIFTLHKSYRKPPKEVVELLEPIFELRGLRIDNREVFLQALEIFVLHNISFADAFNVAYMQSHDMKEIYSFDQDFDKIKEIKRLVP